MEPLPPRLLKLGKNQKYSLRLDNHPALKIVNPETLAQTSTEHCKTCASGLFRLPTSTRTVYFHLVRSEQFFYLR
jgi:hypothetical protein